MKCWGSCLFCSKKSRDSPETMHEWLKHAPGSGGRNKWGSIARPSGWRFKALPISRWSMDQTLQVSNGKNFSCPLNLNIWPHIIAQVYRLSAVHCQMTRYSQRVPGYLTRYSVSANEISFDKKISQWDCVFQIRLGLQENDSPLHLVTSSGFLKA